MWFKVRASDSAFAERSKKHFTYDFRVALPPAEVFVAVTSPVEMGRWLPEIRAAKWVTAAPHGVSSIREVRLATIAVHEKVLIWEPAERFMFTVVRASVPILKRMVEDFRFEPVAGGAATRVRWTVAYQPRTLAMPLEPVLAPRFSRMFEAASQRLTQIGAEGLRA